MKYKEKIATAISTFLATSVALASTEGGIQLGQSRILIEDGAKKAGYALTNHYSSPVLASGTVTNFDGSPTSVFAVSPSIYQIPAGSTAQGNIIQLQQLPQDRESVFWLRIKTVVAEEKKNDDKNPKSVSNSGQFGISIAQRIKIFYRPNGVNEKCAKAVENLSWKKNKNGITVNNKSKVSVSIVEIAEGKKVHKISDVLMPLSSATYSLNINNWERLSMKYVDEYGNFIDVPIEVK